MVLKTRGVACLVLSAGCGLPPLLSEDLYPRDAGALDATPRLRDAAAAALDVGATPDLPAASDAAAAACHPDPLPATLEGVVVDACSGEQLEAHVGIAGQHLCSFAAKGAFYFTNVPAGCRLLNSSHTGYALYSEPIAILPGSNHVRIELSRKGGCEAPAPPPREESCHCDASSSCGG